jgi:class 3 adenylate cyclase/tetratricopeptide (TPR) repeat protein
MPADGGDAGSRERKVATLLFADLVGYTELNERQDPELVQALVARAFDRLSEEVRRYEGFIEKFAGDALLAIFGVPDVHEDDAERAVRASFEMQRAIDELGDELEKEGRPRLGLRIGIETGEVLVDQGRVSNERDRMVTGDPVNTAARLQQAATPGGVVVGPGTYAATRQLIDYDELAPVGLKGKALPLAVWRAVGVKARRGGQRPVLGLEAPIVGRDEELGLLKETLRRTVAEGRPHLVTVVASAGVGKSRLTWELEKYVDGLPEAYHWRKGRCLAYAQASYSALAEAIAADASVRDDDSAEAAASKLEVRLADLAGGEAPDGVLRALRAVLGVGSGDDLGRDELFEACRMHLDLLARRAPLVLVLEDIHWADEGLLDAIEFLARWSEAPILLLCLARHELLERRPAWSGGIPNAATIVLEPLDDRENVAMVDGLLRGGVPDDLRRRIVDVAEGNPLFTEELVRLFVDRGVLRLSDGRWEQARPVDEIEIPVGIQAVLAARLDSLPADEKRLGQDAAVVGRIFWDQVVSHLSGATPPGTHALLRRLRVKELIVPREPSSLADTAEYSFRHVLIRDVAYESLPKLERARKHQQVARWAEERLGDRPDEIVELLAAHYWSALRYREEFASGDAPLDELREKTLDYARRAAARATALWQLEIASRWMRVAVEQSRQLARPPAEHARLLLEYVHAANEFEAVAPMLAITEEAVELLRRDRSDGADRLLLARARQWHGFMQYVAGQTDSARATLREGIEALEGEPPLRERAALLHRLGWTYWRGGPVEQAPELLKQAIAEGQAAGAARVESQATHDLGVTMSHLGSAAEGIALVERSFALAREAQDRALLIRCYINLPTTIVEAGGDYLRAVAMYEEGLTLARRAVNRSAQAWLCTNLGATLATLGRLEEAVAIHREGIAAGEAVGFFRRGLPELAMTLVLAGRYEEALATWEQAREVESDPEPQMELYWTGTEALLRWRDDPQHSVEMLDAALRRRDHVQSGFFDTCRWLVRMAARTGQIERLEPGLAALRAGAAAELGPLLPLHVRWLEALIGPPSEERAAEIGEVATALEEMGHRLLAADALADAALVARRAGVPSEVLESGATDRYDACGTTPVLGALPEMRWVDAAREHEAAR